MVLDYLVSPQAARRKPWEVFVISALFASFGVAVQLFLPSVRGSAVIFAMIPAIPLVWSLLLREEIGEEKRWRYRVSSPLRGPYDFFSYHSTLLSIFAWFFFGALVAYAFWFAALPEPGRALVFQDQLKEIRLIREIIKPVLASTAGEGEGGEGLVARSGLLVSARMQNVFYTLFFHNLQVLALMFLFSLVYGIGSIYLLLWNASVIGVVIGERIHLEGVLGAVTGFASLFPHGVFEVVAYFIACIAGGILSMAIARWRYARHEMRFILQDVATLTVVSVALLAVGALIESVY